jgi:hypothetical protein
MSGAGLLVCWFAGLLVCWFAGFVLIHAMEWGGVGAVFRLGLGLLVAITVIWHMAYWVVFRVRLAIGHHWHVACHYASRPQALEAQQLTADSRGHGPCKLQTRFKHKHKHQPPTGYWLPLPPHTPHVTHTPHHTPHTPTPTPTPTPAARRPPPAAAACSVTCSLLLVACCSCSCSAYWLLLLRAPAPAPCFLLSSLASCFLLSAAFCDSGDSKQQMPTSH